RPVRKHFTVYPEDTTMQRLRVYHNRNPQKAALHPRSQTGVWERGCNPQKRSVKSSFRLRLFLLVVPLLLLGWSLTAAGEETKCATPEQEIKAYLDHKKVVDKTAGMVSDPKVRALANKYGLDVL